MQNKKKREEYFLTREEIFAKSGKKGEDKVGQVLKECYDGRYMHNVLFRYYGFVSEISSVEIDYLCILNKYIYIIEVKNWNHISKYDSKKDEYHVLIQKNSRHFRSPIYQNVKHRELLSQLFNINEKKIVCISIICTDDNSCEMYVKDRNPKHFEDSYVLRIEQLKNKINTYELRYDEEDIEVEDVWTEIERANWGKDKKYQIEHKEYCEKIKELEKQNLYFPKFMKCDLCGGNIILDKRGNSYFGKCTNFPKTCGSKTIPQSDFKHYEIQTWYKEGRIIYKMSIAEYENEINKKKEKLNELQQSLFEMTSCPDYLRNEKYKEIESDNTKQKQKINRLNDKICDQKNEIDKLLMDIKSMKDDIQNLQKEKEIIEDKYERTLKGKVEFIYKRVFNK